MIVRMNAVAGSLDHALQYAQYGPPLTVCSDDYLTSTAATSH